MKWSAICSIWPVVAAAGLSLTYSTTAFDSVSTVQTIGVVGYVGDREEIGPDIRRALFVFVRFRNDTAVNEGCTERASQWREPDQLPELADYVLANDPVPPFDSRSLTDYYYQQSNGRLILYGSIYPEVIVTAGDEGDYGTDGVGVQRLTPELLHFINADPRVDLSEYDENEDGIIDYIVFVVRRVRGWESPRYRHAAGLNFLGYSSTTPEFGADPYRLKKVHASRSGTYIRYNNAGNIFPDLNLVRLVAHEYGHNIWDGDHMKAIGGSNGVPTNGPENVGYLLMAGPGDQGGSLTVSAAERDLLGRGWIKCTTLRRDTIASVADLYSSEVSNCFRIVYSGSDDVSGALYISNRQRVSHFEKLRSESCYGDRSDHGLMTTGLLMTKVDDAGNVATVAADNTLEVSVRADAYAGDMFGAASRTQLTPWTRPNIHGMSGYPPGFVLGEAGFQAIDNIRHDPGDSLAMIFNYTADFRRRPTFRQDATIGSESSGVTISGPTTVVDESELFLATDVVIKGAAIVDAGSKVHVDHAAVVSIDTLRLAGGSTLEVHGTVYVNDALEDDGARVIVGDTGRLEFPIGTASEPKVHPSHEIGSELEVYPNPVYGELTVRVSHAFGEPGHIDVYNVLGQRVAAFKTRGMGSGSEKVVWDTSLLAAGVYYVLLTSNGAMLVRPVVKVE